MVAEFREDENLATEQKCSSRRDEGKRASEEAISKHGLDRCKRRSHPPTETQITLDDIRNPLMLIALLKGLRCTQG